MEASPAIKIEQNCIEIMEEKLYNNCCHYTNSSEGKDLLSYEDEVTIRSESKSSEIECKDIITRCKCTTCICRSKGIDPFSTDYIFTNRSVKIEESFLNETESEHEQISNKDISNDTYIPRTIVSRPQLCDENNCDNEEDIDTAEILSETCSDVPSFESMELSTQKIFKTVLNDVLLHRPHVVNKLGAEKQLKIVLNDILFDPQTGRSITLKEFSIVLVDIENCNQNLNSDKGFNGKVNNTVEGEKNPDTTKCKHKTPHCVNNNNKTKADKSIYSGGKIPAEFPKITKSKKHFCLYCKKLITCFGHHLRSVHKKEPEVIRFSAMDPFSKERFVAIRALRLAGDREYNLKSRPEDRILVRRPKFSSKYVFCGSCGGVIAARNISRHYQLCIKERDDGTKSEMIDTNPAATPFEVKLEKHPCRLDEDVANGTDISNKTSAVYGFKNGKAPANFSKITKFKKHFCLYCKKLITCFSHHIRFVHKKEAEVIRISQMHPNSKERDEAIRVLRLRGDKEHNLNCKPEHRVMVRQSKVPAETVFCESCEGTFAKRSFRKHERECKNRKAHRTKTTAKASET